MDENFKRRQDRVRADLATVERLLGEISDTVTAQAVAFSDNPKAHEPAKAAQAACKKMCIAVAQGHKALNDAATLLGGGDDKNPPDGQ